MIHIIPKQSVLPLYRAVTVPAAVWNGSHSELPWLLSEIKANYSWNVHDSKAKQNTSVKMCDGGCRIVEGSPHSLGGRLPFQTHLGLVVGLSFNLGHTLVFQILQRLQVFFFVFAHSVQRCESGVKQASVWDVNQHSKVDKRHDTLFVLRSSFPRSEWGNSFLPGGARSPVAHVQ